MFLFQREALIISGKEPSPNLRMPALLLACTMLCGLLYADPVSRVEIVTHPGIDASALTSSSLRAIFSLRKRSWNSTTPVRVFVLPDSHPLHQRFCKSVLRIYPYVLRDQWDRVIFSGVGRPPTIVENEAALRKAVTSTPGGIGYIATDNGQSYSGQALAPLTTAAGAPP
ncbi:hypothetical protein [Spongiibacter sp.]|uniref:hypothetical protein n=1 Tax=Spongiibacter sp. TaxID=2024860 RepID=UPI00356674D2